MSFHWFQYLMQCVYSLYVLKSLVIPASVSFHSWHFLIVFSLGNCPYFTGFDVSSNFGLHQGHFECCFVRLAPLISSRECWLFFFCPVRHQPSWVQTELSFCSSLGGSFGISSVLQPLLHLIFLRDFTHSALKGCFSWFLGLEGWHSLSFSLWYCTYFFPTGLLVGLSTEEKNKKK